MANAQAAPCGALYVRDVHLFAHEVRALIDAGQLDFICKVDEVADYWGNLLRDYSDHPALSDDDKVLKVPLSLYGRFVGNNSVCLSLQGMKAMRYPHRSCPSTSSSTCLRGGKMPPSLGYGSQRCRLSCGLAFVWVGCICEVHP